MTLETVVDFALAYAGAGYRVIPVRGKIPLVEHGAHDASIDETVIRAWWSRWPDAGLGMTLDNLVVVDIDPRNGGDVDALPHPLPETCFAKTGGGGWHYLYRASNGTKYPGTFGPGIDLKHGAGAYVVVEPSLHASGEKYCWLDETEPWSQKPAEAPEWLANKPDTQKAQTREHGGKPVELLENIASGNALHDSTCALAAHYVGLGLAFGEICKLLELALLGSKAPHDERWQARFDAIPGLVNSAVVKFRAAPEAHELATIEWPGALNLMALAEREPELPKFIISDWLPAGYATLLAGHGGVGKSAIALHLAVCIAGGVPFFGLEVARRRVLYLSCEDRESVLHWRLSRICSHLGTDLASLRGRLEIIDLVGADSILWDRDPRTGNTITPAYGRLEQRMAEHQTEVLMIDGISDTFAGNENARAEVKRFVNGLVAMIPPDTGAVLLVGHVAKLGSTAGADGQGYSGSTGWHNSVRARWFLFPETIQGEDSERTERTGDLIMELQKSNMGRTDQSIRFSWDQDAHLFLGRETVGATQFDRLYRDRLERHGILCALKACAASNPPIIVPAAMQGPRTAFHVLTQRPELPDTLRSGKPAKRRFWRQIESLRQIHAIAEVEYRRTDRHAGAQLTITAEGMRECGE